MLQKDFIIHAPNLPTQINYSSSFRPTKPDLALAQNVHNVSDVVTMVALSSNHYPIYFSVGGIKDWKKHIHTFCYRNADWTTFRSVLNDNINLTALSFKSKSEIDIAVENFHSTIIKARNLSVPSKTIQEGVFKLPGRIKKLIRFKNSLRRLDNLLPRGYLKKSVRRSIHSIQNIVQSFIKQHTDKVWNDKLSKVDNPSTDIWRLSNSLKRSCTAVLPPLTRPDNTITSTTAEQCDTLAQAFLDNLSLTLNWDTSDTDEEVCESLAVLSEHRINNISKPVRPLEIKNILKTFNNHKSPGCDGIHNLKPV
ncbi:unnamed protein product [Euphydryas editha]|uniref:Uncharacterized protein n=1 Tax=Euphydryas editha TaxID=104508 RepID=A0AAU9UBI8_EUPED|nr:unnamed protein product [Euphydryas editha]